MKLFLILFVTTFVFFSCNNTNTYKSNINRVRVVDIIVDDDYDNILQIDSIFSDINAIKLETKNECLISSVNKVLFYNDKIYILNGQENLFVFTNTGIFISEISNKGKGPGEFFDIRDFQIGEDGKVYILDFQKIIVFSPNKEHLYDINVKTMDNHNLICNPTQFALSEKEGNFYIWGGSFGIKNIDKNQYFAMYKLDEKGNLIEKYFPVTHKIMGNYNRFRQFNNAYNIDPVFGNDTIFSIVSEQVITRYYIDFGKRSLKQEVPNNLVSLSEFKAKIDEHFSTHIRDFIETQFWCYFKFNFRGEVYNAYYSKNKDKTYVSKFYPRVPNRITPYKVDSNRGDELISIIEPHIIIKDIEKRIQAGAKILPEELKLQSTLANVNETDNPVILVCKLKSE